MNNQNKHWWKFLGYRAHMGTNKQDEIKIYIWESDAMLAWDRYQIIPGVKKKPGKELNIDAKPLDKTDVPTLERKIVRSGMPLEKAKQRWFIEP